MIHTRCDYKHTRSGQILLLVILLSMVLLTVGLSTVKLSTEETRIAKLEADSKKAMSAAEAGIEASLQTRDPVNIESLLDTSAGVSGTTVLEPSEQSSTFSTPILYKDDQYTFYLSDYTPLDFDNPNQNQTFGAPYSGSLKIGLVRPTGDYCNDNGNVNAFALELTFINVDNDFTNGFTERMMIDECSLISGALHKRAFDDGDAFDENEIIDLSPSISNSHIVLLRVIAPDNSFDGAVIKIIENVGNLWPSQGTVVTSTATTDTAVSKKVRIFQSYPQLTSDLWVTSF